MCYGYCITAVGLGVCEKRNEWKKKRPARRINGGTGCENFSFSVRAYTVTTRAKPPARAFGRDWTTTCTCTAPTTVVVPHTKVRDNACNHISRWPVGCRRSPQQQRALGMEHLDGSAQRRSHAASRAPTPASGAAVARRALERRPAGARTAQHARLHVVRRAPRSRAALAASPAAPHRLAPPCVARRVAHLARPAACGTARARSVSVRGGKGGHSHTYQEHAHCARARALDAVGRACSCRMRLEGILRVPKSL